MSDPGWCDNCHAAIIPMTLWERWLSIIAWHVWMLLPLSVAFSGIGLKMLPWVGNRAYRCFCRRLTSKDEG
jgi:hypothetical protein